MYTRIHTHTHTHGTHADTHSRVYRCKLIYTTMYMYINMYIQPLQTHTHRYVYTYIQRQKHMCCGGSRRASKDTSTKPRLWPRARGSPVEVAGHVSDKHAGSVSCEHGAVEAAGMQARTPLPSAGLRRLRTARPRA